MCIHCVNGILVLSPLLFSKEQSVRSKFEWHGCVCVVCVCVYVCVVCVYVCVCVTAGWEGQVVSVLWAAHSVGLEFTL